MPRMIAIAMLLCLVAGTSFAQQTKIAPAHGRPFFMPEWRRQQILQLKQKEAWAQQAYGEAQRAALDGDMFWAGFLYALERKEEYAKIASEALRRSAGRDAIGWWRSFDDR